MSTPLFEHPEYTDNYMSWMMYHDLYQGEHSTITMPIYLWKHVLEDNDTQAAAKIRSLRQLRTRYLNTIEPVLSRYISIFFKEKLILSDTISELLTEKTDITGQGHSVHAFFADKVLLTYLLYGRVFIIADNYNVQPINAAQDALVFPTLECLSPLDVPDWEIETEDPTRKGKLRFIRYEYKIVEPRTDSTSKPVESRYSKELKYVNGIYSVRVWKEAQKKQTDVKTNDTQWDLVSEQEFSGFSDLPVRFIFSDSWIKDVAQETLRLYNFMSSRDNILYHQAYQRTFFIGNLNSQQEKAVAEYTAAVLPENTVVQTIEPANPVALDQAIERSINAIFRIAFNQHRTIAADSKVAESSDTQQESKEQLVTLVLSEIDRFEKLINDSVSDLLFFKTKETIDPNIKMSRDLKADDIDKQIQIFAALRDEIVSVPEWRAEVLKKFVQAQDLQNAAPIIKSIENAPVATQTNLQIRNSIFSRLNGNTARDTSNAQGAGQ